MARTRLQRSNVLVAPEADSAKPFLSLNFLKHTVKAFCRELSSKSCPPHPHYLKTKVSKF